MNYKQTNNPIATYGEKSQSVLELQNKLNSMGANLKTDSMYGPKTQEAYNKYMNSSGSSKYSLSNIESPTPATDLKPESNINLPEPESANVYDSYTTSLQKSVEDIRKNLESSYSTKLKKVENERNELQKQQEKYLKETDPSKRETYEQEQRIQANQLQAAETASKTLEEDFTKRRSLTSELENLLTESNALIKKEQGLPVSQRVINTRVSNRLTDISARTGVIEAVFSALDGNISQAHNLINQAKNTVSANWNDNLTYYNTLLDLNNKKILNLDSESKDIAEKQVSLIENDLSKVDKTVEYLKELMIDPETSQFIADSGIKLTDSVEEINTKLSAQSKVQEIADTKNEMATDGYTYVPFPTSTAGLIPITVGGQTLYFKPKPEKAKTTTTSSGAPIVKLTPVQKTELLGLGLKSDDIANIESDISEYGIEETLKGITDDKIKNKIKEIYKVSQESEMTDEEFIRDSLNEKELKKLADWAGVSSFWTGKTKDIARFFEKKPDLLPQIRIALENEYTIDEIIDYLNE